MNALKISLLIFIFTNANAQLFFRDGTLYLKGKTKLVGKVKFKNLNEIEFLNKSFTRNTFHISKLDSLEIDGVPYIIDYVTINNKKELTYLKKVLAGYTNLYEINGIKNDTSKYAFKKRNEDFVVLTQVMGYYEMRKAIFDVNSEHLFRKTFKSQYGYNEGYFSNIFDTYNQLKAPGTPNTFPKSKIRFSVGIADGVSINKMKMNSFKTDGYYNFSVFTKPQVSNHWGFVFMVNPYRTFSLKMNFIFNNFESERMVDGVGSFKGKFEKIYFAEKSLSIPVLARFNFYDKKIQSYLLLGGQYSFENDLIGNHTVAGSNSTNSFFQNDRQFGFGPTGGIGIQKQVFKDYLINLEYRLVSNYIQDIGSASKALGMSNQIGLNLSRVIKLRL
jgi:hypothetical protein